MINVLLVDDLELVRSCIAHLLAENESINVVGVARSGEEAIKMAGTHQPDVVLMDINMPGIGGMEASRKISKKYPHIKIIALSACSDGPIPQQVLSEGVQGYISKNCSITEMIDAVMAVHEGKRYLSPDVASGLALSHLPGAPKGSPFEQLTRRELQIVMLILQGLDVAEVAKILKISSKTVSTYRYRLYQKLEVKNDVELVLLSLRHNLIADPN